MALKPVRRLVFRKTGQDDWNKASGIRPPSGTGGGAKDFRFRPREEFEPIFREMFPRTASVGQTARGQTTQVEEFVGRLCWTDSGGAEQFKDLHYQPLYPARPQEGRLQNVDDYVPISQPPPLEQDPVFLLFQTGDDEVRACYAPLADLEASLASPDAPGAWHPNVAGPVTAAIQNWADQRTPQGYVDYTRGHTSLGTPVEIGGELSPEAVEVLRLLREHHNVLIAGPPATGKTRLLSEVQRGFIQRFGSPAFDSTAAVPVPATPTGATRDWLPSPTRTKRESFPTVFHPHTKHRDFVSGLAPKPTPPDSETGGVAFTVQQGTLMSAAEYAFQPDSAALVVIDEINRGPAVQVFGSAIVGIERSKRKGPDGLPTDETWQFEVLASTGAVQRDFALPWDLYLLAAMNLADTSVEPLDVAFLRRFTPYRLEPGREPIVAHLGLDLNTVDSDIPETAGVAADAYRAAIRAWEAVNRRIALGRGPDFRIGHGVFLEQPAPTSDAVADAVAFLREPWRRVEAHVEEVFFGDTRGIAAALGVGEGTSDHPYMLRRAEFVDQIVFELDRPGAGTNASFYRLLQAVIGS